MTVDQWQRTQELLAEAWELEPERRRAFLAEACGDDAELLQEVTSLLDHDSQAGEEFMRPPKPSASLRSPGTAGGPDLPIGKTIGRYHIKSVIAHGGMGTVYEAVQEQPHRVVALKVMKRHVASRSALRRFQFESQVLGRLRHRNVAQVYEAGTHNDGAGTVPYFAMEYIPGAKPITKYAEEKKLDTRDRLRLFAQVCEAVHHGHQKGVIHRDLKPGNVLVDSSGEPKVIDFGVARATDSDLSVTTQQTYVGQLVGTVQYMSPEQCDADPHDLDTRSDVYSLGVMLYELLAGELPYDASSSTIFQATQIIKERAPRRLSAVNPKLRGDVETITLKALEKDRDRRYQSAAALGEDIRRCVGNEPVAARPPSFVYLTRRFIRRHVWKAAAMAAGGLALTAIVLSAPVYYFLGQAVQERARAEVIAYGARMGAAEAAILDNDATRARDILGRESDRSLNWEWRHLHGRVDQSLRTVVGEGGPFRGMAVHPGGKLIALARRGEEMVWLVDVTTGETVQPLRGNSNQGNQVAFSHDGTLLAVAASLTGAPGDSRRIISLWRLQPTGDYERIADWYADETGVLALAFQPKGLLLASGSVDKTIKLWDVSHPDRFQHAASGTPAQPDATLWGHTNAVRSIAFSPDGTLLASSARDYTVRLWNVNVALRDEGSAELALLRGHTDDVQSVAFSPDGLQLASGSTDGTIRVWDVPGSRHEADDARLSDTYEETTGITLDRLRGHAAGVTSVAFDSTGARLVSGSGDRTLRVWDVRKAVFADYQRTRDWKESGGQEVATLWGHEASVNSVHVLSDGRILSLTADGTVKEWSPDVRDVPQLRGHYTSLTAVAFTPDGRHVISASDKNDDSIIVWDADRCVPVARRYLRYKEGIQDITCLRRGGQVLLAVATENAGSELEFGRVLLWFLDDADQLAQIWSHETTRDESLAYVSVAISSNGNRLAAGSTDGPIHVWDITDLDDVKPKPTLGGHTEHVNSVKFLDSEGRWLVSASGTWSLPESRDHTLRLWDVDSGDQVDVRTEHTDVVCDLAIRPARDRLASGSEDKSVRVWSVDWTGEAPRLKLQETLTGHTDMVLAVVFHPTEPRLLSGSPDQTIKVWDLETMVEVATLRGHRGPVNDLAFDPAGKRLASASGGFRGTDNVARLWEAELGNEDVSRELRRQRGVSMRAHDEVERVLRTAVPTLAEAKRRLLEDELLPDDVRAVIDDRFELLLPHAWWIDLRGRVIAEDSDLTDDEYERGLKWSQTAARLAPKNGRYLTTIGMLQYRLGDYMPALDTLGRAVELDAIPYPSTWAFTAMTHWKLGHADSARNALKEARAAAGNPAVFGFERNPDYLAEAELLISGETVPEADAP